MLGKERKALALDLWTIGSPPLSSLHENIGTRGTLFIFKRREKKFCIGSKKMQIKQLMMRVTLLGFGLIRNYYKVPGLVKAV